MDEERSKALALMELVPAPDYALEEFKQAEYELVITDLQDEAERLGIRLPRDLATRA